ncbi:MAG TPA: leucyl aminopeptidase, partial [Comamonadaceae bacterium]|nr:leucyl aminopeptidase [Comamonadaceae bacterium]
LALAPALKAPGARRVALLLPAQAAAQAVRAAVCAVADVSYVYTATKSKAEPRAVERVTIGVADAAAAREDFAAAQGLVAGIEFAREWANRPANHATPTLLGNAAKALTKLPGIQCTVH